MRIVVAASSALVGLLACVPAAPVDRRDDATQVDAANDAPGDGAPVDADRDAPMIDASVDAAADAPTDAPTDAAVDGGVDAANDAAVDAATDGPIDAPTDAAPVDAAPIDAALIDAGGGGDLDAASPDSGIGSILGGTGGPSPVPCGPTPTITVHLQYRFGFDDLRPQTNARIVFVAPDGTELAMVPDTDGRASAPAVDGTTVFVAGVIGTTEELHVFTHVPACTTIELRPPPWDHHTSGVPQGETRFQFEAPPVRQNALYGPCGLAAGSTTAVVTHTMLHVGGCDAYEHDATLLALSRDHLGISGWTTLDHVDLTAIVGQTVIVPPLAAPVPATVHWSNATVGWGRSDTAFFAYPGLQWIGATQGSGYGVITAASFDHVWRVAPMGSVTLTSSMTERPAVPAGELHTVGRVRPSAGLEGSVDMADAIGTITYVSTGPGLSVHWTWGANATHRGDLVIAQLPGARSLRLYGPGYLDHLEVPGWPAALDDVRPDETHLHASQVTAFDLDDTASYAETLRRGHFTARYLTEPAGPVFPDAAYWRSALAPNFP